MSFGFLRYLLGLYLLVFSTLKLFSAPVQKDDGGLVHLYRLEEVELRGTSRLDINFLKTELSLHQGQLLNDEFVMEARQKLLGLGVFKSVLLFMRKGSKQGLARLIIEVEDDETVLGNWAIGGEMGVTYSEPQATTATEPETLPLGIRLEAIARNIFGELHRGSFLLDINSEGELCEGQLAYGLPRFAKEDVQFDARFLAINIPNRYLNAMGFGKRVDAFWSEDAGTYSSMQYGVSMYINRGKDFSMLSFPKTVVGPKVAYANETRLLGFFPMDGYHYSLSLLFPPGESKYTTLESSFAVTFGIYSHLWNTLQGRILTVGSEGYSFRFENRIDFPLSSGRTIYNKNSDQAELFLKLMTGVDKYDDTDLFGSAAVFGMKYHSSGLIAELAFKITKTPKELDSIKPRGLDHD